MTEANIMLAIAITIFGVVYEIHALTAQLKRSADELGHYVKRIADRLDDNAIDRSLPAGAK